MSLVNLNIYPRTTSGKNANRRTRAAGRVPCVVYGRERDAASFELDSHDFKVMMTRLAGGSAIFALQQEGVEEEHIALMREVQRNPVTDEVLHVDLYEIPRGKNVNVWVRVTVVGTNNAVKTGEGSVALSLDTIELSCRPSELPEHIEVSALELHDKIFVKDIVAPAGEIVSDPEMLVLNIKPASIFVEVDEGEAGAEDAEAAGAEDDDEKSDD
jgi:large subunit ribosomal protein L25